MVSKDHYATLGVTRNADVFVIRAAYCALAKRYHPDTAKEPKETAEALFRQIHEAYEILSDTRQRTAYDHDLGHPAVRTNNSYFDRSAAPEPDRLTSRTQETRNDRQHNPRRNRHRRGPLAVAIDKGKDLAIAVFMILVGGVLLFGLIGVVLIALQIVVDTIG
jgi:DnaJ-class molecular chaperone